MSKKRDLSAFTIKYETLVAALDTEIGISEAYDPTQGGEHPHVYMFNAIWDTGASNSVISKKVIDTLNLQKIDDVKVQTANGLRDSEAYLINIFLPNRVAFSAIRVTDGNITETDVLIGMDIISRGDIAITNKSRKTVMTFQMPSSHSFDFVKEIDRAKPKPGVRKARKKPKRR